MLYQKYRPKDIPEMVGNADMLASFTSHFKQPLHSHAHVISGPRGAGKTTLSRIAAKTLLGADDLGITEVNVGSERGIDAIREIVDMAAYKPFSGKARVFILDEAHGMTTDAKRALLKPTEDVPDFVYYFLCTTAPDKLFKGDEGAALKSRMTLWHVSPLSLSEMESLLLNVLSKENVGMRRDVLDSIIRESEGVPRTALTLLEQALSGSTGTLKSSAEIAIIDFCRNLYKSHAKPHMWSIVAAQLKELKKQGVSAEAIRHTALTYAGSALLAKSDVAALDIIDLMSEPVYDSGEMYPKLIAQSYKICNCTI